MKLFKLKKQLLQQLRMLRAEGRSIALVPTMGALHKGHLSLIALAKQNADIVVSSIFVNPTQFTDPKDLERYPRPIEADIEKLTNAGCDILFNPEVDEMYADNEQWHLGLGELEFLLEGEFRPGHYQGVTQVVFKLFDIVKPDVALFGQKDYQQFLVISKMVSVLNLPVKLIMCPIQRDPDGLAMSSRNVHLSAEERQRALILSKALFWLKDNFAPAKMEAVRAQAALMIKKQEGVDLEYLSLADGDTLKPADEKSARIVALVAAKVGKTRLIDNVIV
ncbi:pantoate--beta-alanine ligase [Mucilaginibacter myungsuensis]|uniref:Pantothenate synthetase n=1 Tax=Mucilaginibacter myungsuensis TaxID=649104 RepID=A0A929PY50_9SPHI|nr:pantoate--beta-alanine ligase [Mucilaginibacter myungsuensis]MBE9663814.1 pantoate--beta-alanine ligase [Mucilaginibacter myungsuensis]MDN3598471.1 pantoate--beta-alanine ligase [Mucilaginibacter myungsuensis]